MIICDLPLPVSTIFLVPKDDDDDLPDADYDDDDVFDTKEEQPEETAKKIVSAKRRSQSLSALKDKDERSPRKVCARSFV